MKKILTLIAAVMCFSTVMNAQDGAEAKKFRFGFRVSPTPYWLRSDNIKAYTGNGTKFGFGIGLQMEFKLTNSVSFCSGLGWDFEGGKQKYLSNATDTFSYALDATLAPIQNTSITATTWAQTGVKGYKVIDRSVKASYVTIPLTLKMMTDEISGMKYFFLGGVNVGILTKAKATDDVQEYVSKKTSTITDIDIKSDCNPIKIGLNVGGGVEYRIAGKTSLYATVNYLRAFTNMYKGTSDYLFTQAYSNFTVNKAKQGASIDGIQLNIGVLF
jgi:hypothetical protein